MAISAASIVTNAYYLSTIVSRELETVGKDDMTDGFNLLNYILGDKNFNVAAIPFYKEYTRNAVIGQEAYFIPNLLLDETLTFNIGDVRFPTQKVNRRQYFGQGRVDFSSLIVSWHPERVLNGTNIYLFPFPESTYPMKIWGKFALTQLESKDDDLSLSYEVAYLDYLTYKLASRICQQNNIGVPPNVAQEIKEFELQLSAMNPIDFTVQTYSTLSNDDFGPTWAQVNLNGYWGP